MARRTGLLQTALDTRKSQHQDQAFFLADLLVGAAIGTVLVASLGGLALISEIKYNRNALENQNLQLKWSRSLAFITNEAQQAYWISTVPSLPLGYPCEGGIPTNPLVLDGPPTPSNPAVPAWRVVYGVRANGNNSKEWKGENRLVRCGPPFEATARNDQSQKSQLSSDVVQAAVNANLNPGASYQETFITDQLARISDRPCPTPNTPGTCKQPFDVKLFNSKGTRDRSALINLFLSLGDGHLFPKPTIREDQSEELGRFHAQIHAFRTPGLTPIGDSSCLISPNLSVNAEPTDSSCQTVRVDTSARQIINKSFSIPTGSGTYRINACGPTCDGPLVSNVNEMIYLNAPFSSFKTIQYSASDTRPCSRQSCYLGGDGSRIQIFDGNMLIFTDRVIRL